MIVKKAFEVSLNRNLLQKEHIIYKIVDFIEPPEVSEHPHLSYQTPLHHLSTE